MNIDLGNITEQEALQYLDELTNEGLNKQQGAIALFSIRVLTNALHELNTFRNTLQSVEKGEAPG